MIRAIVKGVFASLILLLIYFLVVSLVSGWNFMLEQFAQYWYFVVPLATGFGIQVGLYSYLKDAMKRKHAAPGKVLAVSGTTSTAAMVSCCAHYLVNVLPILGTVGVISIISQYQVQLFWVGLMFNFVGIAYMAHKVYRFSKNV